MYWLIWFQISFFLQIQVSQSTNIDFPPAVCEVYQKDGDYIIGGIFTTYMPLTCHGEVSDEISFIEAMTYAIEVINNHSRLLQGANLGYEIRSSCNDEDITLWTVMTMTTSLGRYEYTETCPEPERTNSGNVVGIIGTGTSTTSIIAAKACRVVTVPLISYYATSDELSDSESFPFFFRTVPPDKYQVEMIIDILRHFNWKYIALFYSLDSYGVYGARQIVRLAEMYDICIAINVAVSPPASKEEIKEMADKLSKYDKVSVIVSFSVWTGALAVLEAVTLLDTPRKFTFIGSDDWNPVSLSDFEDVFVGGIFFHFRSKVPVAFPNTFLEYFSQLPYNQQHVSQWYKEKLRQMQISENCTDWSSCPVPVHWNTQQVVNSVYALAYALNETLRETSMNQSVDGWLLRQKLLEVSIPSKNDDDFFFDENGEVAGTYEINNWQIKNGVYELVDIGTWDSHQEPHLNLDEGRIQWNTVNLEVPISLCIQECESGYVQVPLEKKCCWGCHKCDDYEIVGTKNNVSKCQECLITEWPDVNATTCAAIEPSFLAHSSPVFSLTIVGACAGLVLIVLGAVGMRYYYEHPLIKASSRELCAINLVGLASLCIAVMFNLLQPTDVACGVIEFSTAIAFCISFTPVLLKVNRIWRIFNRKPGEELQVRWKSPRSQVILALCIIGIAVLLTIISSASDPSTPALLIPPRRKPYLEIYCRFGNGFFVPCAYNALIIIGSCYYAFKARKVPDNFNESKFIALSVYSTLIFCLAAIPVYATATKVGQKIGALSLPLLVNIYLSLFCLYFPKLYAIYFKKENDRNVGISSGSNTASSSHQAPMTGTSSAQTQSTG